MSLSRMARLRRLWLDVHLWIGVGLLVLLIPVSVTGAILVWHDALDRVLYADRYAVTGPEASMPADAYAAAAQAAFAGKATLTQVRLPQEAGDPVVAVGRLDGPAPKGGRPRTLNAWIDPPTGKVLATGEIAATLTNIMHRVHGSLLIPGIGRKVVGWLGWAMFVSCATGLWLWWPRHAGFVKGLRWRRGPSTLFNLHHMIGFWVCIPLAVLSLTGVYISFPQTSRALFGVAQPQPRPGGPGGGGPGRFPAPVAAPTTSFAQAVAVAQAANPGAQLASVSTPTVGDEPTWRVQLAVAGREAPVTVQVVDATGQVKAGGRGERAGGGGPDPLSRWMRRIHDGADMGIVWQTIIFIGGMAPAVLGVTGVIMWLRRRGRRLAQTRRLAEA